MHDSTLIGNVLKRVLQAEQANIKNDKPNTKYEMIDKLEDIIKEEVDKYETGAN